MVRRMLEATTIPGPAGALEARVEVGRSGRWAILCHPHPLYGGSMHDAVLETLAGVLAEQDIGRVRFNFRGVGASDGQYDEGRGEADDVVAVRDWLAAEHAPEALWLAGYSFGSSVVWRARNRIPEARRIVLIAPPVGAMEFAPPDEALAAEVTVVAGDGDAFVDLDALRQWSGDRCDLRTVAGADHFFAGRWEALATTLRRP